MNPAEEYLASNRSRFQDELLQFLSIPSVSSEPGNAGDVERAAQWVAERLRAAGMEHIEIMPTGGHPVVYADHLHAEGQPTVLLYGHFDTQPVDPLELWSSPPFEPVIRDGRVYARGACDDKGNMLIPILALEALLKSSGGLPVNVKVLFEGQEEIGSPQLPQFLAAERERFACDYVLSADSGQYSETEPCLGLSCRGLCAVQIDVRGARTDLHSGVYGGAVANPLHVLVGLLASLRDGEGRVTVEGFYDRVVPLTAEERDAIARVPFDEEAYQAQLGVEALAGEAGYSPVERVWARPTLELNGVWGGFQGEGVKTVLPKEAHAKLTCRLVADQDPVEVSSAVVRHVEQWAESRQPLGVRVEARALPGNALPYSVPAEHPANQAAAAVLRELYGREPYLVRGGGSVPVCELFFTHLGVHTIGFGFGLDDEQIHAPDEFFRLSSFERGQTAWVKLLQRVGDQIAN